MELTMRGGACVLGGRRVLLLQGPVGPFFARLADDLRAIGATVYKINFNAGDWLFYPRDAIPFRGTLEDWPRFLGEVLDQYHIDKVLVFGDCRPMHQMARRVARARGIDLDVFEEGYIRPDYVTFEHHGVNAHSRLPRDPRHYLTQPDRPKPPHQHLPNAYWHMVLWGFLYFLAGSLGQWAFPHYRHHRPMNLAQCWPWIRSALRKQEYRRGEKRMLQRLTGELSGRFFLVPLQVHNDAQVTHHSEHRDVAAFIEEVIASFARAGGADDFLVLKHHPMDRGYTHYGKHIAALAQRHGVAGRCLYAHDLHIPTLLAHTRGVVVINSSAGLQALSKGVPVKAVGHAIYDMEGLCFQGKLDQFWAGAAQAAPAPRLLQQFVGALIQRTQVNANFYRVRPGADTATGMQWQLGAPLADSGVMRDYTAQGAVAERPETAQGVRPDTAITLIVNTQRPAHA